MSNFSHSHFGQFRFFALAFFCQSRKKPGDAGCRFSQTAIRGWRYDEIHFAIPPGTNYNSFVQVFKEAQLNPQVAFARDQRTRLPFSLHGNVSIWMWHGPRSIYISQSGKMTPPSESKFCKNLQRSSSVVVFYIRERNNAKHWLGIPIFCLEIRPLLFFIKFL